MVPWYTWQHKGVIFHQCVLSVATASREERWHSKGCRGRKRGGEGGKEAGAKREQKAHGSLFGSIKCDATKSHTQPSPHAYIQYIHLAWRQGVSSEKWMDSSADLGVLWRQPQPSCPGGRGGSTVGIQLFSKWFITSKCWAKKYWVESKKKNKHLLSPPLPPVIYLLKLRLSVFTIYCNVSVLETMGLKRRSKSGDKMFNVHNTKKNQKKTKTSWYDRTFQRRWNCPPASSL